MFPDGKRFMCMVLFLVRREHLWTQVFQKTRFSQIINFLKEAHLGVKKKPSSQEGYTLSNTSMVKPRFYRCSLMVKVLCVWYYSWSGKGVSLNPGFVKNTIFHKFSVFVKRHILRSKMSSSQDGYTLSNTCMVKPSFYRCSLMVKVLCVLLPSWSGGSIFEPRFCKKKTIFTNSQFL